MTKKKKRSTNQRKNEITKGIFTVLEKDGNIALNYKQIAAAIGITDGNGRNELIKRLAQLRDKKRIIEVSPGKYKAIASTRTYHEGSIDVTGRGNAYVIIDGFVLSNFYTTSGSPIVKVATNVSNFELSIFSLFE